MQYKTVILIDGENLVFRYQEMKNNGMIPLDTVIHIKDSFVWEPNVSRIFGLQDIVRVSYYSTVVGNEEKLDDIKQKISESTFYFVSLNNLEWHGTLVPYLFKKNKKSTKTKSVDINLTIDALRYAYGNSIDKIIIITGDGDYIPLLREIMARGKMVQVYALSSGLNKYIKHNVDDLILIDKCFFKTEKSLEEQIVDLNDLEKD